VSPKIAPEKVGGVAVRPRATTSCPASCIRPAPCLYRLSRYTPPNPWAWHYLLEGEEADRQRLEDVRFWSCADRASAADLYAERFCRMWENYLVAVDDGLSNGDNMVFQPLLSAKIDAVPIARGYVVDDLRVGVGRVSGSTRWSSVLLHTAFSAPGRSGIVRVMRRLVKGRFRPFAHFQHCTGK
jgi:hypothetical protein